MAKRYGWAEWGHNKSRKRTSAQYWKQPLKWNRWAKAIDDDPDTQHFVATGVLTVERQRVFCASLSDWLDDEVPIEWLRDLLLLIDKTRNLDWLLLTKRPQNWRERIRDALFHMEGADGSVWDCWLQGEPPPNVWIGTTVENQEYADKRIPELLKIPARVRFLSCEPLLGPVDLTRVSGFTNGKTTWTENVLQTAVNPRYQHIIPKLNGIDWVICGGESGPGRRPFSPDWARSLREQCASAGVAFFMKQWDKVKPIPDDLMIREFPTAHIHD